MQYRNKEFILLIFLIGIIVIVDAIQNFKTTPRDTRARVNHTVVMQCHVNDQGGMVQWARDGVMLGASRDLPGYPRYRLIGNSNKGEHDLQIEHVRLEDDATFECQVSPYAHHKPLKASAVLTVLVPPTTIEVRNYPRDGVVQVPYTKTSVVLECRCQYGRPAPIIYWIKNGRNVTGGVVNTQHIKPGNSKLFQTRSKITIRPQFHAEENNAIYTCVAYNDAVQDALQTFIRLSIQYPPDVPVITGYTTGHSLSVGQSLRLVCTAKGGNPLGSVVWLRDGVQKDFSFIERGDQTVNEIVIRVQSSDNNVTYRCEVSNVVTPNPLGAEIKLTVYFAPMVAKITGQNLTKAGQDVTLTCESGHSNPPADIKWYPSESNIRLIKTSRRVDPVNGGYITTSKVKVRVPQGRKEATFSCHASNQETGNHVIDTFSISVQYPPNKPVISGYRRNQTLRAGHQHTFTCKSKGGNPLAKLSFYMGARKIPGTYRHIGDESQLDVSIPIQAKDNGQLLKCKAKNIATTRDLETKVALSVHFGPATVNITVSKSTVRSGEPVKLYCEASSSNPPAQIIWLQDNTEIVGSSANSTAGKYGGRISSGELRLVPDGHYDGRVYGCRAVNRMLFEATHDGITLRVLYKPLFDSSLSQTIRGAAGKPLSIPLAVKANPGHIVFTLHKGRRKLTGSKYRFTPGVLNISSVSQMDSGGYVITASNTEGKSFYNFTLDVQYGIVITRAATPIMADVGGTAKLSCKLRGNPVKAEDISWLREGFDMTKTEQQFLNNTATLTISHIAETDSGKFTCKAANGFGFPVQRTIQLIVKFKPQIDKSRELSKAASDQGKNGRLICRARGAPAVKFIWFKNGLKLNLKKRSKYRNQTSKENLLKYSSVLTIRKVAMSDYGNYTCQATNSKGVDHFSIIFDGTSKPDPPYNIRFVNATHNSITISWTPGFNGGLLQQYTVRYRQIGENLFVHIDIPAGSTVFTASGLKLDTGYEISVRSVNDLGHSFYPPPLRAKTDRHKFSTSNNSRGKADCYFALFSLRHVLSRS